MYVTERIRTCFGAFALVKALLIVFLMIRLSTFGGTFEDRVITILRWALVGSGVVSEGGAAAGVLLFLWIVVQGVSGCEAAAAAVVAYDL